MSNAERVSKLVAEIDEIERELAAMPTKEKRQAKERIEVKRRMLRCMRPDTDAGSK